MGTPVYLRYNVMVLAGIGFSSGFPIAFTSSTLQAWLFSEGIDLKTIGFFSIVGLPYTLKVLWAPLIDRYALPWFGRRKGWIFLSQCVLALLIFLLSLIAMNFKNFRAEVVAILAFLIAFFSATQDISVDAYRTDILKPEERGAGAATTVLGYRIAMLVSGAGALIISDHFGWSTTFSAMALVMFLCCGFTVISREPFYYQKGPSSLKEAVFSPLKNYFSRDNALGMLLFIVFFKMPDVLAGAITTPFILDLGFSRSDVGFINKAFGLGSSIIGALIGGALVAKLGLNRSLWVFSALQAFSNFSFAILAYSGKNYPVLVASVGIENLTGGMGTAGFVAFLMSLCDKRYSASQYALLSGISAIVRVIAGVPTGMLADRLGWFYYYAFTVLGAVPIFILLFLFVPWNAKGDRISRQ